MQMECPDAEQVRLDLSVGPVHHQTRSVLYIAITMALLRSNNRNSVHICSTETIKRRTTHQTAALFQQRAKHRPTHTHTHARARAKSNESEFYLHGSQNALGLS